MAERNRPQVFTIPAHRGFADALVSGLMRRARDPMKLARGIVLLPNNRGVRAVTQAFVRASGGGLLLPRLIPLGDPDLGEAVGAPIDGTDDPDPPPPAVEPLRRRMILARLVADARAGQGRPVGVGEAVRLAGEAARALDQMLVEGVSPQKLQHIDLAPELSEHWQRALGAMNVILDQWPRELERLGCIDAVERRSLVLDRLAHQWGRSAPAGFVCAAGITDSAPAVARLLRTVSEMPDGSVVFAGLDLQMPGTEWDALGPHEPDPASGTTTRSIETHPQFHLKLLLNRMGIAREEVALWRGSGDYDAGAARGVAIANALAPAEFTGKWTALKAEDRRLRGVSTAEFATAADEAQAIALALRGALETPARTAALVTPDRALARRVAKHLERWGIRIDDSAGQPLSMLPPGTLLLLLAEAAAQGFVPLALLALLKHPLVRSGEERLPWLDRVRQLDLALRGLRPPGGLDGIADRLSAEDSLGQWWCALQPLLEPLSKCFEQGAQPLAPLLADLRNTAQCLCGDALWAGPAGRAAADFLSDLEIQAGEGPALIDPLELPTLLRALLDEIAVRPMHNGHPRVAIYGLIEARLQTVDLMILGGLNEGVWPGRPAPDPWLAPRIRAALGLPGLEQRIGIAAHDFAQRLGAPQVVLTRARRDATAPALPSRLWLRLQAMAGDRLERDTALEAHALLLDTPDSYSPAPRPAPQPAAALRPKRISVTEVDRLKADPYAFYARHILKLVPLEAVDADPSAAWRGSAVHKFLEQWWEQDRCAVDMLRPRALQMLRDEHALPLMRALWEPRLIEAIDWIETKVADQVSAGRDVISAEGRGTISFAGVTLNGRYDRVDRMPDGSIAIVDYKTGKPPSAAAVREGFSLQLGLLGLIAERQGFDKIFGKATSFEYWSLAKRSGEFGYVDSPVHPDGARGKVPTADFVAIAARNFADVAGRWLTGDDAFTAKLFPAYAPYAEYDQLMRRDEWYGRDG